MPAALSGPGGLHCRRQCPGERPYTSAPLSFGQCPLPCPAQKACIAGDSAPGRGHTHQRPLVVGLCPPPCLVREVCIAGDSASGRGHTYQRPFVIRQCPLPLPANLSVLLTLPCPGALSLSFHLLPGRTCPQALACSLPFGKKRKNPRPSMRCCLNQYCGLHLLLPHPRLLPSCARPVSPCLRLLTSPRTCS